MQSSDQDSFVQHIQSQIIELSQEVKQNLQVISEMNEMVMVNSSLNIARHRSYDILMGMRNEVMLITQRVKIDIDDMDDYFMTYMKRYKNNFQIAGSPSAVFYDEEYIPSNSDIELRIPVMQGMMKT